MGLNLLMEKDASGTTTKTYTHGYSPIDGIGSVVVAIDAVHGCQYPTYDHRGTVQMVLDDAETVRNDYEHNAFGEEEKRTEAEANRFTYQSNWYIVRSSGGAEAHLLSPTRVFHPATGLFLQRDPARKLWALFRSTGSSSPGQWSHALNRWNPIGLPARDRYKPSYGYAGNSPVRFVDPSGLEYGETTKEEKTRREGAWSGWNKYDRYVLPHRRIATRSKWNRRTGCCRKGEVYADMRYVLRKRSRTVYMDVEEVVSGYSEEDARKLEDYERTERHFLMQGGSPGDALPGMWGPTHGEEAMVEQLSAPSSAEIFYKEAEKIKARRKVLSRKYLRTEAVGTEEEHEYRERLMMRTKKTEWGKPFKSTEEACSGLRRKMWEQKGWQPLV